MAERLGRLGGPALGLVRTWQPSRRLYLDLRNPDESPAADTRTYLSGMPFGVPVEADGKIRVPLWGSKKQVLDDVGRYYSAA